MSSQEGLEAVPGFAPVSEGDLEEQLGEEQTEETERPPTTSTPQPPPSHEPTPPSPSTSSTSSPASTAEPPVDVAEAIGAFAESCAHLLGVFINKVVKVRRRSETRLWLMTADEAHNIGAPLGRIAARKAPAELVEGDGGDLLEAGSHFAGYAMHNALGVDGETMERAQRGEVIDVPSTPVPPPAPANPPPPAPGRAAAGPRLETAPAEPGPPPVIPIDI
jgi:hypothetical protein